MISGPEAGTNPHRIVQGTSCVLCGLEVSFCSISCKTQAVCQRDCICPAREVLENTGLHTKVWEEQVTVLVVLTNLKINYGCDAVLTEQGLAFNPGNKQCCTIQTVSAERQMGARGPFLSQSCNEASGDKQCKDRPSSYCLFFVPPLCSGRP